MPPPRSVKFTGAATALLAVVALIAAGALAFMLFFVGPRVEQQKLRDDLLSREGVLVQGRITRTWTTPSKNSRNYHVAYSYDVNHKIYHSEAQVASRVYSALAVNSGVGLHYAMSRPEISMLEGEIRNPAWVLYFMVLPITGIVIIFPFVILRQKRLLESGQPTGAIVTRSAPVKGGRGISYQFLDFANNTVTGNVTMRPGDAPAVGKTVTVLYDPSRPKRNAIYPPQFVRLKTQ